LFLSITFSLSSFTISLIYNESSLHKHNTHFDSNLKSLTEDAIFNFSSFSFFKNMNYPYLYK
jgi:hypothetical protein